MQLKYSSWNVWRNIWDNLDSIHTIPICLSSNIWRTILGQRCELWQENDIFQNSFKPASFDGWLILDYSECSVRKFTIKVTCFMHCRTAASGMQGYVAFSSWNSLRIWMLWLWPNSAILSSISNTAQSRISN